MTFQIMIYVTEFAVHNVGTHSSSYRNPVMFVVGHPKNIKMHIPANRNNNSSQCFCVRLRTLQTLTRLTDGVCQGRKRNPRGHRSGIGIFFQYEYSRYYDSNAHDHNSVNA